MDKTTTAYLTCEEKLTNHIYHGKLYDKCCPQT